MDFRKVHDNELKKGQINYKWCSLQDFLHAGLGFLGKSCYGDSDVTMYLKIVALGYNIYRHLFSNQTRFKIACYLFSFINFLIN